MNKIINYFKERKETKQLLKMAKKYPRLMKHWLMHGQTEECIESMKIQEIFKKGREIK